ncbi:6-phosphogluconolactonase [Saccharicrinis carchari]|uniref:6-phosphogluconolactonase n=1 Tax=Saccharicrinis carchari TaxID=1168039 RepID=A0A521DIK8_SACCC|nr:lactonase family protein [Saccharicrinis carchari]SMO71563.1 6-phosphogluconolactonase [Saccharicrinis carchari]
MNKLVFFVCAAVALCSCKHTAVNSKVLMYVGATSNDSLKGIEYCYFDTVSGQIGELALASQMLNPNFLEVDRQNNLLFAVGQSQEPQAKSSLLRCYKVNDSNGAITPISEALVPGQGSCYVALDQSREKVMVANYSSGDVCVFHFLNNQLSYLNSVQHYGTGPDKSRQEAAHAHSINIDPGSDRIYSADLGADKLMVYTITENGLKTLDSVLCRPGAGPRHFDFSPNGKILAVVNELDCTVSTFAIDDTGVYKEAMQTLSMLPDTFSGVAYCADIHFSPDGKFLYASNRGFDCIAVFEVSGTHLQRVELMTDGIKWPRNFAIDPSGNFVLVANRDANNITVYKRNKKNGKLTRLPHTVETERPICIKFFS